MADEFQTGVCGENWWNSSRTTTAFGSSPCSSLLNDMGSFGWPLDMKARSTTTDGSMLLFHDIQNPHQSIGLSSSSSSPTTDWNQSLLHVTGRAETNYHPMLQEDLNSSFNYRQDSFVNGNKPVNQGFSLGHQPLNSMASSRECSETCQGLDNSFPMTSASCDYPSTLLQTLFDTDSEPQEPLFDNQSMNYPSTTNNYRKRLNEFSSSMHKFSSLQKQQAPSHLHLSKDTPLWTASAGAPNDIRASLFPSMQSQCLTPTFEQKPNCPNLTAKPNNEEVGDSGSVVKKSISEPAFKRQRIETPSPLPTFKVRKEKLGDRITALQQLVSPFGKTDTASVLHEAIEYIKLLHDQVSVLSTPYMKNGGPAQHQQNPNKLKDTEGTKQDLKSRGLCLVPISSTFPVAPETTADFWAPTFGGIFSKLRWV